MIELRSLKSQKEQINSQMNDNDANQEENQVEEQVDKNDIGCAEEKNKESDYQRATSHDAEGEEEEEDFESDMDVDEKKNDSENSLEPIRKTVICSKKKIIRVEQEIIETSTLDMDLMSTLEKDQLANRNLKYA